MEDYDGSVSSLKSPVKTSTVAKENIKWNEDAFFKRLNLNQASDSIFITQPESPISTSEVTNFHQDALKNPVFQLNDSSVSSDGANSSLGILNVDNISGFNESFFNYCPELGQQKSKKKIQRSSRVGDIDLTNLELDKATNNGSGSSSSDVEFDGTNIPELNLDFDALSLISNKGYVSSSKKLNGVKDIGNNSTLETTKESKNSEKFSLFIENGNCEKSTNVENETSRNTRLSIFENFEPAYDSLYQQLAQTQEGSLKHKRLKNLQKIKVCPFPGIDSFEVERVLQPDTSSSVENTRHSENQSVDFYPEMISARSSSLQSSLKFTSSTLDISEEMSNDKFCQLASSNASLCSPDKDLKNEILSASWFQTSGMKLESQMKNSDKDSGFSGKTDNSCTFQEVALESADESNDLAFHKKLSENQCSLLEISESGFFTSEAAIEMLKKDKEAFEKEHMFEIENANKISEVSKWSPTDQHEISPPSWYHDLSSTRIPDSFRQTSIGTLFSAKSENLGTLSEDSSRQRPYFGTTVTTPTKNRQSNRCIRDSSVLQIGAAERVNPFDLEHSNLNDMRVSNISELLADISLSDPSKIASKLLEKYEANMQKSSQIIKESSKSHASCKVSKENENNSNSHAPCRILDENVKSSITSQGNKNVSNNELSNCIEYSGDVESENTLIQSVSSNNITEQNETNLNGACKSTQYTESMFSMESTSNRDNITANKDDVCFSIASQHNMPPIFSRPDSSCSSNSKEALQNTFNIQNSYATSRASKGSENNFNSLPSEEPKDDGKSCSASLEYKNVSNIQLSSHVEYSVDVEEESENTLVQSVSANSIAEQSDTLKYSDCKTTSKSTQFSESLQKMDSTGERDFMKTKSGVCCNMLSQHNMPSEFSRPASPCSSTCSNPMASQNAFSVQYGCLKYLNSMQEHNQIMVPNVNGMQQCGNVALTCSHGCPQHIMQPNFLSTGIPNSFQPVVQNTLTSHQLPLLLSGIPVPYPGVQAPEELYFPDKIAIGDSQEINLTVQNTAAISYYNISYLSTYLDNLPLPSEMSGLSFNKTVPCAAGGITDIKLIIAPKYEGKFQVNLQITCYFGQSVNIAPGVTMKTHIHYEAVRPSISLLSKGRDSLNLGSVIIGSTFMEYITLINNCDVAIPLRISLSNESQDNEIDFGLKELPTSGGLRFLSPKIFLYRLPGTKNKSVPSRLDIPVVFECVKCNVNATITAAVETPTLCEVLSYFKISASVGSAALILKDSSQNPLLLKAGMGTTCSRSLTVMNDGTLPVTYDFQISGESDCFSVSPNSFSFQPKQCATVSVIFTPVALHAVKGNLLAAAEPHGQVFPIAEVIGEVLPSASHHGWPTRHSNDSSKLPNLIECNKKFLAWGGIDIGNNVIKSFSMKNPGTKTVRVKLFLKDKSRVFQLISSSNDKRSSYVLALRPKEEKLISVAFMPRGTTGYSGLLGIKSLEKDDSRAFSMSLSGYGGTSKIEILGLPHSDRIGYSLDVHCLDKTDIVNENITIQNVGLQAAFVKILITSDSFVHSSVENQSTVHPSEFVLLKNEKKDLTMYLDCSNRSPHLNTENIVILYGDEVARQSLKRSIHSSAAAANYPFYNIDFTVPYDGEDRVPYDLSFVLASKDPSLFYSKIKKMIIRVHFNIQNTSFSRMSFGALSVLEQNISNITMDSTTPAKLQSEIVIKNEVCNFGQTVPGVKSTKKIIIKNISLQDIQFAVIKPNYPFYINHSSITVRSKRFLEIPVHFRPMKTASFYKDTIIFRAQNRFFKVMLKGSTS